MTERLKAEIFTFQLQVRMFPEIEDVTSSHIAWASEKFSWQVTCRDGNRWLRRGLILSSQYFCQRNTLMFVEWCSWKGSLRSPVQPFCLTDGETEAQKSEVYPNYSDCLFILPTPIHPPHLSLLNKKMNKTEGGVCILIYPFIYSTNILWAFTIYQVPF